MDFSTKGLKKRSFVFFLVPHFTLLPFTAAIETLRVANRMLGYAAYSWRLCSADGQKVYSSCNIGVEVHSSVTDERRNLMSENRPDMVFACSGVFVKEFRNKSTFAWLRETYHRGVAVGSLCTGTHILAQAGLLNSIRCAIHWENLPGFMESFPQAEPCANLYEIDSNIYTCAGGTASFDMMLHIVRQDFGDEIVNRVCEQQMTDHIRHPHERQRLPLRARLGAQNSKILSIVARMEKSIAEPRSLEVIAEEIGLSRRQVERLFRQEMRSSPARYYLNIRLERARHLLIQSSLPVVEVAVACGFVSASHFSKCYREIFKRSPQQERTEHQVTLDNLRADIAA
jgi:transcriptional regulator GlxA family with amidase domain